MARLRVRVTTMLCVIAGAMAWSHLAFSQDPPDLTGSCNGDLDAGNCLWMPVATVYAYAGDQRRSTWVPHPDDMFRRDRMYYQAEVYTVPSEIRVVTAETAVAQEEFLWTPQSAGHYRIQVRACDPDMVDPADECSEWADSLDDAVTASGFPGWMIYAGIKPPTGGGIE